MKGFILFLLFFINSCEQPVTQDNKSVRILSSTPISPGPTLHKYLGSTCSGTTNDGETDGFPIYNLNMRMASELSWSPQQQHSYSSVPTIDEMYSIFQTKNKLQVRLKANQQPFQDDSLLSTCDGLSELSQDDNKYEALSYYVHIKQFSCHEFENGNCISMKLSGPIDSFVIKKVSTDQCSSILDLSEYLEDRVFGIAITIDQIKGHYNCLNGECETKAIPTGQCWDSTLQVVTDHTGDFLL